QLLHRDDVLRKLDDGATQPFEVVRVFECEGTAHPAARERRHMMILALRRDLCCALSSEFLIDRYGCLDLVVGRSNAAFRDRRGSPINLEKGQLGPLGGVLVEAPRSV